MELKEELRIQTHADNVYKLAAGSESRVFLGMPAPQ
jgi:hypothetical protein